MKVSIKKVKPNPLNDEIYSSSDLSDLVESIKLNGQLESINVNKKMTIISGHRRYYSMLQLGFKEVEVEVKEYDDELIGLIEHNRYRVKTVQDILNESRFLEQQYKKRIGQGKRTDLSKKGKMSTIVEVSKTVGVGTTKLKQIKSISNYEPELLDKIDKGELTVKGAYTLVREKHMKTKQKTDKGQFSNKFRTLIKQYEPSPEEIDSILNSTYPYSLKKIDNKHNVYQKRRDKLVDNLNNIKRLDAKQEVIYRKYQEIEQMDLNHYKCEVMFENLWDVDDINNEKKTLKQIENLEPELTIVDESNLEEFNILRILLSSFEWSPNPGRLVKVIVTDKSSGKYLGVLTLASDIPSLDVRDKFIGWSDLHKFENGRLRNSGVGSSIVPIQPMGYNFLGGKLLATLITNKVIRDEWENRYSDKLIGITTTSLYGDYSMYNSIPIWKKLGHTKGKVLIKPDQIEYEYWLKVLKKHYPDEYKGCVKTDSKSSNPKTSPKQNVLNLMYNVLGIKQTDFVSEFHRGVYYSLLYANGKDYLLNKIKDKDLELNPKIDETKLLDWWKTKASKRYLKLKSDGKLQTDRLWYKNISKQDVRNYLKSTGIKI